MRDKKNARCEIENVRCQTQNTARQEYKKGEDKTTGNLGVNS